MFKPLFVIVQQAVKTLDGTGNAFLQHEDVYSCLVVAAHRLIDTTTQLTLVQATL